MLAINERYDSECRVQSAEWLLRCTATNDRFPPIL